MSLQKRLEKHFSQSDGGSHSKLLLSHVRKHPALWEELFHGHPLEDEWRDWSRSELLNHLAPRAGHVYVAANPATHVPVVKVGQTRLEPQRRISALRTAGVLGGFVLLANFAVADRHHIESEVLDHLRSKHEHDRELFRASSGEVLAELDRAVLGEVLLMEKLGLDREALLAPFGLAG